MTTSEIALYCRPRCAACATLACWLDEHRVRWVMADVTADASAAERVTRLGYWSRPVVETPDGRSAWGGDLGAVAQLLDRRPHRLEVTPDLQPGGVNHG